MCAGAGVCVRVCGVGGGGREAVASVVFAQNKIANNIGKICY